MPWTAPDDLVWETGDIPTAAQIKAQLLDNLRYLKGADGTVDLASAILANFFVNAVNMMPHRTPVVSHAHICAGQVAYSNQTSVSFSFTKAFIGGQPRGMSATNLQSGSFGGAPIITAWSGTGATISIGGSGISGFITFIAEGPS